MLNKQDESNTNLEGVSFDVKYLGSTLVETPNGEGSTAEAIKTVITMVRAKSFFLSNTISPHLTPSFWWLIFIIFFIRVCWKTEKPCFAVRLTLRRKILKHCSLQNISCVGLFFLSIMGLVCFCKTLSSGKSLLDVWLKCGMLYS